MNYFNFICFLSVICTASKIQTQDNEFKMKLCIKNGIEKYFGKNTNILLIVDMLYINLPLIENPHDILRSERNLKNDCYKYKNYLVLGETYLILKTNIKKLINSKYWDAKECMTKRVVVFTFSQKNIKEIFKFLWENNLYNVMLIEFANNFTEIFTANPFTKASQCGKKVELEYKGTCEKIKSILISKYPQTLKGCQIQFNLLNKIYSNDLIHEDFASEKPGVFVKPMKIISELYHLNVTTKTLDQNDVKEYQERTSYKYVKRNNNEVLFGIYRMPAKYMYLETTKSFLQDKHCWIIQKPDKLSNIKIIASVFNKDIWIYNIIAFVTYYCVVLIWIKYKNDFFATSSLLLDLYRITVVSSLNKLPETGLLKCLIFCYIYFTYHINIYFQAKLGSILTAPLYEKEITTFEELANSTFIPVDFYEMSRRMLNNSESYASMKLFNRSILYRDTERDRIKFVLEHKNTAIIINCKITRNLTNAHEELLSKFPDKGVIPIYVTYCMVYGSPFIALFNQVIRGVVEGGLVIKWLSDNKKFSFLPAQNYNVVLTLDHVKAANIIIFLGLMLAFTIFLFEILVYKYQVNFLIDVV